MKSALGPEAPDGKPSSTTLAPPGSRYSIFGKLRNTGRAKLFVALPRFARSMEQVVVIKAYESAGNDGDVDARAQLEVASTPRHENLVRVLECGWGSGRHFIVSEYLEGTTLRRLLRWLDERGQDLPDAATARILVGMLAAVEHAIDRAQSQQARALARQPLEATNVFITSAGGVKVLGFKPPARSAPSDGPPPHLEPAAVDDLLSRQRSPALRSVLARIGMLSSSASLVGLPQIVRILRDWQRHELGSDGAAELAEVMAGVQPEERAARRMRVEAALARVLRTRDEAGPLSAAHGHRSAKSDAGEVIAQPDSVDEPERMAQPPEPRAGTDPAVEPPRRHAPSGIGLMVRVALMMAGVAVAGQLGWRAPTASPAPLAAAARAFAKDVAAPPADVAAPAARGAGMAIDVDATPLDAGLPAHGSIMPESSSLPPTSLPIRCRTRRCIPSLARAARPGATTTDARFAAAGGAPGLRARGRATPPASEPVAPSANSDSMQTSGERPRDEGVETDNIDPWRI